MHDILPDRRACPRYGLTISPVSFVSSKITLGTGVISCVGSEITLGTGVISCVGSLVTSGTGLVSFIASRGPAHLWGPSAGERRRGEGSAESQAANH